MEYLLDWAVVILTIMYAIVLMAYRFWFGKMGAFQLNQIEQVRPEQSATQFTVIIPARNEAANIKACVDSILNQDYPAAAFEIIVIDDFSEDDTAFIVHALSQQYPQLRLLKLADHCKDGDTLAYKKKAIEIAVAQAKGDWILTTDADCIVPSRWLLLYNAYIHQHQPCFVAAPVMFIKTAGILNQFQVLDFLALQGITAAAVGAGKHSMSNGANLGFEKAAFIAVGGYQGVDHIASGDDMFLMHKMKQTLHKPVGYLFHPDAIVLTAAMDTWKGFIMQRIRWASKARYYDDHSITMVLTLVYFFNLSFICLALMGSWSTLLIALAFKTFFELFFLDPVAKFFQMQPELKYFVFYQPIHIVYNIAAGLFGQLKTYSWKGRKVK
ncbi:MAG: glycosyltransferase [Chitinophagaceae bacterium]|nr:glycosyltransferase [Chitinophagaceae bacterium]MCF8422485.1 glycosyltransferase [Chitinophagaceae bacterium]